MKIKDILENLENLNFKPKGPESLTNATLITLGAKIKTISDRGVVSDDDLKWIRGYCNDIRHFWVNPPKWLRIGLNKLSSSASFNAIEVKKYVSEEKVKIEEIKYSYIRLAENFIGIYHRVAA